MKNMRNLAAAALLLAGCASGHIGMAASSQDDAMADGADMRSAEAVSEREMMMRIMAEMDFGRPYLASQGDGAEALVPGPPARGSAMLSRDEAHSLASLKLKDTPRWYLAMRDADLRKGKPLESFACAAGVALGDETTPKTAELLRRARSDFGASTSGVKKQYQRPRPFMVNGEASCTPDAEAFLARDGSYPSGHAAIGYGTSLVLAALLPERAGDLVKRGIIYGESRQICNVHWSSDVEAARPIAAATFAQLIGNAEFRADLEAARAELAALGDGGEAIEACTLEQAALKQSKL